MSALEQASSDVKRERLDARVTTEQKEIIQQAAAIRHVSVTDFVVESALERAYETLESHARWELDAEQSRAFAALLLDPPEPNEALRKAAEAHRELFGE
jgi:uncharacterized protein (DUF1778 family)